MRMRAHVHADAGLEPDRAEVIEKNERSDGLMTERGQHAADGEPAEIAQMGTEQRGGFGHDCPLMYRTRTAPSALRGTGRPEATER